jgi:hypothetical protein
MKYLELALAPLRWVWSYFVWAWNWLEDKNYDPPPVSLKKMFYIVVTMVGVGVWIGYVLFHSPMKIPAADKFVSALPAASLPVEPALPAIFPKQLNPGPLPVAATPLPCVPTPAVKVLNPAKPVKKATTRKSRVVRKPAAESTFWGF